ncbi:hypothetical protein CC1G_15622 [Coprinopsis cinerea okayama7|uniref:Uncharacterized protein n=1 Tax=Coprinopsis cinerea (strain Okayama-7 / 130 / ATCC MYA-4618 / FGSC 9003) TaxID=240176 RepID=D6RNF2_COPC7|nr:hypothetical protein CC1G_15622 [Coprinopsis cinerea okayama7\|eukprot:XP_002911080.1 hypothetical protein CC1G_15622 [Coprinopsis cinerea okayama7\
MRLHAPKHINTSGKPAKTPGGGKGFGRVAGKGVAEQRRSSERQQWWSGKLCGCVFLEFLLGPRTPCDVTVRSLHQMAHQSGREHNYAELCRRKNRKSRKKEGEKQERGRWNGSQNGKEGGPLGPGIEGVLVPKLYEFWVT